MFANQTYPFRLRPLSPRLHRAELYALAMASRDVVASRVTPLARFHPLRIAGPFPIDHAALAAEQARPVAEARFRARQSGTPAWLHALRRSA